MIASEMKTKRQLSLGIADKTLPYSVLPYDGESIYYGPLFGADEADSHLRYLLNTISWKHDEAIMFGRHITTARQVSWYGDRNYDYTYSGRTRRALVWTPELRALKELVEEHAAAEYNSCLLNLYADGNQGMSWHQDNEAELGTAPNIASISFGAVRRFDFRHRESKDKISLMLEHGSLLVMKGSTQTHWQHQLPKSKKIHSPRVNLTFRQITIE